MQSKGPLSTGDFCCDFVVILGEPQKVFRDPGFREFGIIDPYVNKYFAKLIY